MANKSNPLGLPKDPFGRNYLQEQTVRQLAGLIDRKAFTTGQPNPAALAAARAQLQRKAAAEPRTRTPAGPPLYLAPGRAVAEIPANPRESAEQYRQRLLQMGQRLLLADKEGKARAGDRQRLSEITHALASENGGTPPVLQQILGKPSAPGMAWNAAPPRANQMVMQADTRRPANQMTIREATTGELLTADLLNIPHALYAAMKRAEEKPIREVGVLRKDPDLIAESSRTLAANAPSAKLPVTRIAEDMVEDKLSGIPLDLMTFLVPEAGLPAKVAKFVKAAKKTVKLAGAGTQAYQDAISAGIERHGKDPTNRYDVADVINDPSAWQDIRNGALGSAVITVGTDAATGSIDHGSAAKAGRKQAAKTVPTLLSTVASNVGKTGAKTAVKVGGEAAKQYVQTGTIYDPDALKQAALTELLNGGAATTFDAVRHMSHAHIK
ncbi:MAG TPA: hypothetical protein VGL77_11085 [Armatimonadota bacterium]|jgi:hypothetical protein